MPRAPDAKSLGVVLFQNTATHPSDAFLGVALGIRVAEELLATGDIPVVASQKFGYEMLATPRGVSEVARTLGVRYVLGAKVGRMETGEITVLAELRRAKDGATVWSLRRSSAMREVPGLVADLVDGVVATLTNRELASRPTAARLAGWSNIPAGEAVDHYLRGAYYSSLNTIADYEAALAQFDSASMMDPGSSIAFASSALTIAKMLEWGWWDYGAQRVAQLAERGLAAADRALQIDSSNAHAWVARGSLLSFRNPRTYAGVFGSYTRAIAYSAHDPVVHHWYGRALMQVGERTAARRELSKALDLAPTDAGVLFDFARLYRHDGSYNSACILLDSAVAASPTAAQVYILRALTRARRGELRFAWADAETGGRLGWPLWGQAASAAIDARARDTTGARERTDIVRKAAAAAGTHPREWTGEYLALALVASGQKERALDVLESAQPRGARLWFALTGPDFAALRKQPRYQKLVAASRPRR
ncbi:MAG TPA: hypothetical protein VFK04_01970 [Gemmatimonadaceae bacterium]|nr:hypothetical protein [Gemmatimonadaceae bacterium]